RQPPALTVVLQVLLHLSFSQPFRRESGSGPIHSCGSACEQDPDAAFVSMPDPLRGLKRRPRSRRSVRALVDPPIVVG
ncbi:MAG TPA: hypothetical protein VF711_11475, partial [Acidimicrobiales bacterium]